MIRYFEEIEMCRDKVLSPMLRFGKYDILHLLTRGLSLSLISWVALGIAAAQNVTPASWWSADIGFNDALGNNPGTQIGNVSFVPGVQSGQAFHFDGSGYIVIKNNSATLSPTAQVMIVAWIRPNFAVSNIIDSIISK